MLGTAAKIGMARMLSSALLRAGLRADRRIRRHGITYEADLREGIDLSLFLAGGFQRHVMNAIREVAPADGVVIDVGANIGAVTLPAAAHVRHGHVYAFEPTGYAHAKLLRNLELNPHLSARVTVVQSFVADRVAETSEMTAYSSWPVAGGAGDGDVHPVHKGVAKQADCGQTTLDRFVGERGIGKISLIKIDTDGHEFAVLSGAGECLRRFRPVVLFEACEYLMRPPRPGWSTFEELFRDAGYTIRRRLRGPVLGEAEFFAKCPRGGGLDLVAAPA